MTRAKKIIVMAAWLVECSLLGCALRCGVEAVRMEWMRLRRRIFTEKGRCTLYLADNLETEADNTFSRSG